MNLNKRLEAWRSWPESACVNFFQTYFWAELLNLGYPGFQPDPIVDENYLIPLMRKRRALGLADSLYGMPFLTTGGFLSRPGGRSTDPAEILLALRSARAVSVCVTSPPGTAFPIEGGFDAGRRSTHLVDLTKGWDAVWAGFGHRARTAVRKAELLGVEIRRDHSPAGVDAFWAIVEEMIPHWRLNPPPSRLFINACAAHPASRIYIAEHQGRPVCAGLCFNYGREAFFWLWGRTRQEPPQGAYNLLCTLALREACAEGVERANLGSSMGLESIQRFKESLGGVETSYQVITRMHPLLGALRRPREA